MRQVLCLISLFAVAVTASASTLYAQEDTSAKDSKVKSTIEQVTVSARKTEENQLTVPVALTAITSSQLEQSFVQDMSSLDGFSPNVLIEFGSGSGANIPHASIRGIGQTDPDSAIEPVIVVVIDGFAIGRMNGSLVNLFDVEQIEVIRGPQGTLFGRNTIAGVMNITTRRPTNEFEGRAKIEVGSWGRVDGHLTFNIPIVEDKLAVSVASIYKSYHGIKTNLMTGKKIGGAKTFASRAKFLFTPNDNFDALLTFEIVRDRPDDRSFENWTQEDQLLATVFGGVGNLPGTLDNPFIVTSGTYAEGDYKQKTFYNLFGVYLNMNYDFGSMTLTSITGYRDSHENYNEDFDNLPNPAIKVLDAPRETTVEQFSQELRLASDTSSAFNWLVGAYFNRGEFNALDDWVIFAQAQHLGIAAQTDKAISVFALLNYTIQERLRLSVGGRYTHQSKDFFRQPPSPISTDPIEPGSGKESWGSFTPQATIDYSITDNVHVYASYARGFRSGGFSGRANSKRTIGPYDPETVDSYELGLKSELFENRLFLSVTGFFNQYKDLQLNTTIASEGGVGFDTIIANAAAVETKGFEIEFSAVPVEGLTIFGNVAILDNKFTEFGADINGDGVIDEELGLSLRLTRAPKFSGTIGFDYTWQAGNFGSLTLASKLVHRSSTDVDSLNRDFAKRAPLTLIDASLTYISVGETWSVSVYGKNLTDKHYVQNSTTVAGFLSFGHHGNPRQWGVTAEVEF